MRVILAVSGGVDSVVMLHALLNSSAAFNNYQFSVHDLVNDKLMKNEKGEVKNNYKFELVIAHIDHGLRADSAADARFVAGLAEQYGLKFEQTRLELGAGSEASARAGRWQFLHEIKEKYKADAIATAHHQDDVVETMLINLLRGTNRKGLTSLRQRPGVLRPLLGLSKSDIYDYALEHNLEWVRDGSNDSDDYLRNRIRHYLTPRLTDGQKQQLLDVYKNLTQINQNLDQSLRAAADELAEPSAHGIRIETKHVNQLESQLQYELFATWWQQLHGSPPPDSLQLERMVAAIREPKTGNIYQMANGTRLQINRGNFELFINDD
jgi:tRNA(Ile)-lysidine synthetase-like protein